MLLAVDVVFVDIMTILNFESTDVILSLAFLWSSFVSMLCLLFLVVISYSAQRNSLNPTTEGKIVGDVCSSEIK